MSDPFERYLGLYDPVDKLMAAYVALVLLWLVGATFKRSLGADSYGPQEQATILTEPALQHLERGGTYTLPRWHGGDLVLRGARAVESYPADELPDRDEDEPDEPEP